MPIPISDFSFKLATASSFDECLSHMFDVVSSQGFSSLAYTYTPVMVAHDGAMLPPNLVRSRALPRDHDQVWLEQGLFAVDAAWQECKTRSMPFVWSCREREGGDLDSFNINRGESTRPIVDYVLSVGLTLGITLPIRSADGSLTTITASVLYPEKGREIIVNQLMADFTLYALQLHQDIAQWIDCSDLLCPHFKLTPREIECLRLAARGYTTEQVAEQIFRSVPTASLHLKNATKKLGAHNRSQALARASYYKLLEGHC